MTQQLAQALQRVALLEVDRQSADRLQFLAEASEVLSESLVEEETLDKVAHLAVPRFADWATVELVDPDGTPRLVAVAHRDPEMARWARDLREANPPDMSAATGLPNVVRSGRPELYEDIPDSLLDRIGVDSDGRDLVRRLQLRSVILVPLTRREKVLGVITFVQSESGRHYDRTDLEVAEDLGRRAATALENARLYEAEHRARERLAVVSQASRILAGIPRLSGDPRACGPARRQSPRRRGRRLRRPGGRRGVPGRSGRPP